MHNRRICFLIMFALATARSATAQVSYFAPGNLVVYRSGANGNSGLTKTGDPVFVDEYTPSGTLVKSLEMPTTTNGTQLAFYSDGQATSEGGLTVSPNGQYIAITGYGAMSPDGVTTLPNTAVPRVVGIINTSTGAIDTSTAPADYAIGNNPRSAVTTDGNSIWMAGAAGGVRYATLGTQGAGSTSTQISSSPSNARQVNIFGGQLYVSSSAGGQGLLDSLGTGLPTTSGQPATPVPGFPTTSDTAHMNPYSYFFAELNPSDGDTVDTLYVADDTTHPVGTAAGGITKYSLDSGTWVAKGSIDETSSNYRGLTGVVENGKVILFSTRLGGSTAAGGGQIVTLTDTSGYDGAFTAAPILVSTAATNEAFRGIGIVPPTTIVHFAGDFNLDGQVDSADILPMMKALANPSQYEINNSLSADDMLAIGDVNHDGKVNNADLQYLLAKLNSGGLAGVPEPASIALAGLSFVGLCLVARRIRQNA